MLFRRYFKWVAALLPVLVLLSCNTLKYVPEGQTLLKKNVVMTDDKSVSKGDLEKYIRQTPNKKTLSLFKIKLGIYSLSNPEKTTGFSQKLRNMGEPPVIYDSLQAESSRKAMERYMFGQGFFLSHVDFSTVTKKRRTTVTYHAHPSTPYIVKSYSFPTSETDSLTSLIKRTFSSTAIQAGTRFSGDALDEERKRIETIAKRNGYYAFAKDYLSFSVDTAWKTNSVTIDLKLQPAVNYKVFDTVVVEPHVKYRIDEICFLMDVPLSVLQYNGTIDLTGYDTASVDGCSFVYSEKPFLKPQILVDNCFVRKRELYNPAGVEKTYERLNKLKNLKYVNIRFKELDSSSPEEKHLACLLFLSSGDVNTISFELEGTNTAGDLGVAGSLNYAHLNMGHRGQELDVSVRAAYEAMSSQSSNYFEYGGEIAYKLPSFAFPIAREKRRLVDAQTSFQIGYNNINRPEFVRTQASASMKYIWSRTQLSNTLSPIDIAVVRMGRVDSAFAATYLKEGSYLKYSYQDQLIVRIHGSVLYSNVPFGRRTDNTRYYTLRATAEESGNILSLVVPAFSEKNSDGAYTIGNIPYSQYVRGEVEFVHNIPITDRLRFAYRAGIGIGYPYGNSIALPFEKRFYTGGANSMRGWSVRTLGPGSYRSPDGAINFMTQSGDLKADLNFELRHKWFSVFEGGYFIDFGNVWNLSPEACEQQPKGAFRFDSFYKQIACSIGLGIRLNVKFFVMRVDCGLKVFDPSGSDRRDRWRISHIEGWDDFALHLAVGYPF